MNYLFLDTNVFIHYRRFDQVDWCDLLGVSEITLVILPKVLHELDKIKHGNKSSKTKKRIQGVTKLIEEILATPDKLVRKGISLQFEQKHIEVDFNEHGLMPVFQTTRFLPES